MSKVLTHLQTIRQTPHTQACRRSCLCPHTGRDIGTHQTGMEMKPALTNTSRCVINSVSNHFWACVLTGLHENEELEDLKILSKQKSSPLFCDWQICDGIWVPPNKVNQSAAYRIYRIDQKCSFFSQFVFFFKILWHKQQISSLVRGICKANNKYSQCLSVKAKLIFLLNKLLKQNCQNDCWHTTYV